MGMLGAILRKNVSRKLNIISHSTHESYQTNLSKTGHNFYIVEGPNMKVWNSTFRPVPDNHFIYNGQLPNYIDYDLILCQNKHGQYEIDVQLSRGLHIPIVSITHTFPLAGAAAIAKHKAQWVHKEVFISSANRDAWGFSEGAASVVEHGIDLDEFAPFPYKKNGTILSVANEFKERDYVLGYKFWEQVTAGLPRFHMGDSKDGWSKAAKDMGELVKAYNECSVFVDTANCSPIPTVLLEAMACGAICVSYGNGLIPTIIKDGENGFIRNTVEGMRATIIDILNHPDKFAHIGQNARKTIKERFSLGRFVEDWNKVFEEVAQIPYRGEYN